MIEWQVDSTVIFGEFHVWIEDCIWLEEIAGRYLTLFFIYKPNNLALIISARDMDEKERKLYGHS